MQNNLLYVADFAKMLKTTSATVLNWINNNQLPENSIMNIGRKRIRRKIIENYYNINLDKILTFEEAAKELDISKENIKVLFSRNKLPSFLKTKIVGIARIKGDKLEKFINGE